MELHKQPTATTMRTLHWTVSYEQCGQLRGALAYLSINGMRTLQLGYAELMNQVGGGGGRNLDMKAGIIKAVSDVSYTLICAAAQKPLNEHAQGYKDSHTITHIYIQREVFSRPGDTFVTKFNFSLAFNANSSVNSHSQNICFPDFYNPT